MAQDWITDRRPTAADADPDGNVIARHDGLLNDPCVNYEEITAICHWRRTSSWQPPIPTIKVGQIWRRADGMQVHVYKDDGTDTGPLRIGPTQEQAYWYNRSGRPAFVADDSWRLVELIKDLPEQAQLSGPKPAEIPEPICNGVAPFYVLVVGDDGGPYCNGEPIVFETQIPAGSSLQAVLQQRQRVGSRYGTTYVAECRIIPELTEVPF